MVGIKKRNFAPLESLSVEEPSSKTTSIDVWSISRPLGRTRVGQEPLYFR